MPEHPAQSSDIEQILPAGFKVAKWLGVGNFGKVCRAKGQGGFECAFKIIEMTRGKAVGLKEFRALRVIRRIKPHRNLIEYLGVWLITSEGEILDNADQLQDEDLQKLDVAELIIQMPLAVKSLEVRLKECRREFKNRTDRQPGDLPGIPLPELLPYMRGVAEALDHLHSPIHPLSEKGLGWIMHRDVKPANILIDRTGNVVVADYGVARAVGADLKTTQSGAGTPIYSAPEQITDKVEVLDPASDQYSLAITYFELRTGILPFAEDSMGDVQSLKLAHTLGRLDFSILPRNEVSVLKRATNRTVNRRFPSCVEFIDELWKANGVTPMQSGFIQRPKPRVPTDSSAEFALVPPPQPLPPPEDSPIDGNRTPFESGTAPDFKQAAEEAATADPTGTLRPGEQLRATPFPIPKAAEDALPLAEEEQAPAPWQVPPPAKPKSKSAPEIDVKPKPKSSIDINVGGAGTAPWSSTPKPKSNAAIDLDAEQDPGPASWHGAAANKKKGLNPLVLVGGGIAVAAVAAIAAVLMSGPKAEVKPTEPEQAKNDKKEDPPKKPDDLIPPVKPPDKIDPKPPTTTDSAKELAAALASVRELLTRTPPAVQDALDILVKLKDKPAAVSKLETEWTFLSKLPPKPSLKDAERFDQWEPAKELDPLDHAPLRAEYTRLKAANPTGAARLAAARMLLNAPAAMSALGPPAPVLPMVAVQHLNALVTLEPPPAVAEPAGALDKAWSKALDLDAKFVSRATSLEDVEESARAMRSAADLPKVDRESLAAFHRSRLAWLVERFARKPIGVMTAADWSGLRTRLPNVQELPGSPELAMLATESELLTDAMKPKPGRPEIKFAPPMGVDSSYRALLKTQIDFNNARTAQAKRDAVQPLLDALAGAGEWLDHDSRKIAAGAMLASASAEFKQPIAGPDTPFAAEKQAELAKQCLLQANALLAKSKEHDAVREQVRRDLLRALAFPKPDLAAAKPIPFTLEQIEAAPAEERKALYFAFAKTRPAGSADALAAFEHLAKDAVAEAKGKTDLAPLAGMAKHLREFAAGTADAQKPEAARKLLLPLVNELFARRAALKGDDKTLLIDLAADTAKFGKADALEVLNLLVQLELKNAVPDLMVVKGLHNRLDSDLSSTLLALTELRKAKAETDPAEKVKLLTTGVHAVAAAKKRFELDNPQKLFELLDRESMSAYLELGRAHHLSGSQSQSQGWAKHGNKEQADALYKKSVREFGDAVGSLTNFVDRAKTRPGSEADVRAARVLLGRCYWELSNSNDWEERLASARAALAPIKPEDPEFPEAVHWLALAQMYENSLIKHSGRLAFDSEKTKLLATKPDKKAEWDKVLEILAKAPAGQSPYSLEVLEWRACAAAARANADPSNTADRDKALKELDALAAADPLCGALRRLQFLAWRAESAVERNDTAELKQRDIAGLWDPAGPFIERFKKLTSPPRVPGSPEPAQRLRSALASLLDVHMLAVPGRKSSAAQRRVVFEAIHDTKPDAAAISEIDDLAMKFAIGAAKLRGENKPEAEAAAADSAIHLFHFVGQLDPKLAYAADWDRKTILNGGAFRDYVAGAVAIPLKDKFKPDQLKADFEGVDLLLEIDSVYEQGEMLLLRIPNPDKTEKEKLTAATNNLKDMKTLWFNDGLDPAIDAADKAGDKDRAKAWREFRTRRLGK